MPADDEGGQASVELLAGVPALLLSGLIALQLLAAGYSLTLIDGAVEAGAMALAAGRPVAPAVRAALPGWARDRVHVDVDGGRVSVRLRPPSPFAAVARRLEVDSAAWVRPPRRR
jgi:hypothetical protein